MKNIFDYTLKDLQVILESVGIKKFKAQQIFEWIYKKNIYSFDEMSNVSKRDIETLKEMFTINLLKIEKKLSSSDGTNKYLLELEDGNLIESVLMEYKYGYSLCVSSQVGCRMGCVFCASAELGLTRDLTSGEIISQIITIQNDINDKIPRIVIMGIGEPFDNFDNTIKFIKTANEAKGLNIGGRRLTLSTCGIVPRIYEFADLNLQVNLSISLHQVKDIKRSEVMPINKKYDIDELMKACRYYIKKTNRRISFEYAIIGGENDTEKDAYELIDLLKHMLCYVNVIPINKIKSSGIKYDKKKNIKEFCDILLKNNIQVTIRRELGSDIDAACGQLRRSHIDEL